jgi:hydrogenase expression/formation protein HypD
MTCAAIRERAEDLYRRIRAAASDPLSFMEVCGTHTMAISRFGIRSRLPSTLRLLSGPGCPVCVTPASDIDHFIAMGREPGVTIATFGDMMRVPGSASSLERERAAGADVRVVYSPLDALGLARALPDRMVVFMGVGFETTSPTIAATILRAAEERLDNFAVYPAFKTVPTAMAALASSREVRLDGFICPGHVSAIIGSAPYEPIARDHGMPCVVAGFEAIDVLEAVLMLVEQRASRRAEVEVQYRRAVRREGNPAALRTIGSVFRACDAVWRGIGPIPGTGLDLAPGYERFDARRRVQVEVPSAGSGMPDGCSCGAVMRGLVTPLECPLFGTSCTPRSPVGPCMVSSEGACAAYHRYGEGGADE